MARTFYGHVFLFQRSECRLNESRNKAREEERKDAKSKDILSQVITWVAEAFKGRPLTYSRIVNVPVPYESDFFVLGTSASSSGYASDNAEIEKALGHLDTFLDKMSELFGVADVIAGFNSKLAATVQVIHALN